jgi:cobalt-zinc-cadmium efflux system membrane fusion protein
VLSLLLTACGNGSVSGGASGEAASTDEQESSAVTPDVIELSQEEAGTIRIETVVVERRSLASHLEAMGRVLADPYRQAIVSYPFTARIAEIEARIGDWVDPGEKLLVLQSEEVGEATSAFYRAIADHELATANYERETQLYENGVGARKNYASAETELRVAEANLEAAEKKLHVLGFTEEAIRALIETHQVNPTVTLFAPIGGKVVTSNAVLGGMVDETTGILTILDPTRLWVEASVYEKDIARVQVGQQVQVTVAAYPEDVFQGTITFISDVLDPETRAITVHTEVPNPDQKLKSGMFADVLIELSQNHGALAVPPEAVLDENGQPMVFVQVAPRRYEPRQVVIGAMESAFLEVVEGLDAGELVVTRVNFQLKEALLHSAHIH